MLPSPDPAVVKENYYTKVCFMSTFNNKTKNNTKVKLSNKTTQ